MELFDRVLAKLHRSGPDKPIDITRAIRQEMDRQAVPMSRERVVAPNRFQVFLTPQTNAAFEKWGKTALQSEFARDAQIYAEEQNYSLVGSVRIELLSAPEGTRKTEVRAHSVQGVQCFDSTPNRPNVSTPAGNNVAASQNWKPDFLPVSAASANGQDSRLCPPPGTSNVESPSPVNQPLLEVIGGQTYLLMGSHTVVGRGNNVDISIQDASVSHQHFAIDRQAGSYIIRDLDSTNGTYVEGNKIQEATLVNGNTITAGKAKLIFSYQPVTEKRGSVSE